MDNQLVRRLLWAAAASAFAYRIYIGLAKLNKAAPAPAQPEWPKLAFKTGSNTEPFTTGSKPTAGPSQSQG